MAETPAAQPKSLHEIIREVGSYAPEAFEFVRDAVTVASERVHGPLSKPQQKLARWMNKHGVGFDDLQRLYERNELPPAVRLLLEEAGGIEAMNRHVSGRELSLVLRDLAIERWGFLARQVLSHWGIHSTHDFGRIVFALVDNHILSKQPGDSLRDFDRVYDFADAFDRGYTVRAVKPG